MIAIEFTRLALDDIRRARAAIVESHPGGPETGEALADAVSARLAQAVEGLREFPRIGHASAVPGVLEIVVRGPTRRLTYTIGYRLHGERVTILGITWGGRNFGELRRR